LVFAVTIRTEQKSSGFLRFRVIRLRLSQKGTLNVKLHVKSANQNCTI
jgi:hypothetical protein